MEKKAQMIKKRRQTKKLRTLLFGPFFHHLTSKKSLPFFSMVGLMFHEAVFASDAEVQLQLASERQHHLQRRH